MSDSCGHTSCEVGEGGRLLAVLHSASPTAK